MKAAMSTKAPDVAFASIRGTLAQFQMDSETEFTRAKAESRRKQNGANEVAVQKGRPVLALLVNRRQRVTLPPLGRSIV